MDIENSAMKAFVGSVVEGSVVEKEDIRNTSTIKIKNFKERNIVV